MALDASGDSGGNAGKMGKKARFHWLEKLYSLRMAAYTQ